MEFIPEGITVGVQAPGLTPNLPGGEKPSRAQLTKIFSELTGSAGYKACQIGDDGSSAQMGDGDRGSLSIVPPLIQVSEGGSPDAAPGRRSTHIQAIFKTVLRAIGDPQLFHLGVQAGWHVPAPGGEATRFTRERLLEQAAAHFHELGDEPDPWAGIAIVLKVGASEATTIKIEPLHADNSYLWVQIDRQQAGPTSLEQIAEGISELDSFVDTKVRRYLEAMK